MKKPNSTRAPLGAAGPKGLPFIRACFALTQGRAGNEGVDAVLRRIGCDVAPLIVTRADATVGTTTVSGWADALAIESYGEFLKDISPYSGAAKIISLSMKAEMGSSILQNYPVRSGAIVAAGWVAESGATPVWTNAFSGIELGPRRKLSSIIAWTNELGRRANAMAIFSEMLRAELIAALDAAFLSADAGTAAVHQGLLYGVTVTASTAGDAKSDLSALADAVATSGSGDVVFIAPPALVARLRIVEPQLAASIDISPSAALPSGRVVAIDPRAIITAVDKEPDLFVSKNASLHMSDVPLELVDASAVKADPHRSLFQTDSVALRITQNLCFAKSRSSAVSFIDGANWL